MPCDRKPAGEGLRFSTMATAPPPDPTGSWASWQDLLLWSYIIKAPSAHVKAWPLAPPSASCCFIAPSMTPCWIYGGWPDGGPREGGAARSLCISSFLHQPFAAFPCISGTEPDKVICLMHLLYLPPPSVCLSVCPSVPTPPSTVKLTQNT